MTTKATTKVMNGLLNAFYAYSAAPAA
jgi:hypothetical protein